MVGVGPLCFVG